MKRDSIFYQPFSRSPTLLFDLIPDAPENAESYRFDSVAVKEPTFEIDGVFLPPDGEAGIVFFTEVQFQKDEKLCERAFAESFLYFYRSREQFSDWRLVFIYPSRSTEQGNSYPYRALLASDQVHRIYLNEVATDFWQLPLWVGLMVLTTVSNEEEVFTKAKYLIDQSQRQKPQAESRAIIEMVTTIISYQFKQLSKQEIYAMLDFNVQETSIYREVRQEAQLALIMRILRKRFSALPEETVIRLSGLSTSDLEDLAEAQVEFKGIRDLQNWIKRFSNSEK